MGQIGGSIGTKHNRVGGGATVGLGVQAGAGIEKSKSGNHLDVHGKVGAAAGVGGYVEGKARLPNPLPHL